MPPKEKNSIEHYPVIPYILKNIHERALKPQPEQISLEERLMLCDELSIIFPNTPTWQQAKSFFTAWEWGEQAAVTYLQRIGISNDHGRVKLSPDWRDRPLPMEFMDLPWYLSTIPGISDETLDRAKRAAGSVEDAYWRLKGILSPKGIDGKSMSLLVSPAVNALKRGIREIEKTSVAIFGMSEDEVYGLTKAGLTVIGMNAGYSPGLQEMIAKKRVVELPNQYINPASLPKGFYVMQRNVLDGPLPFPDGSTAVAANYVMHHIPIDQQEKVLREMMRIAPAIQGGKLVVIGEDSGYYGNVGLKVGMNDTSAVIWDAEISLVNGMRTIDNLKQLDTLQSIIETPPIPPFAKKIMLPTTTLMLGWREKKR